MNKYKAYVKDTDNKVVLHKYESDSKDTVLNWIMNKLYSDFGNGGMSAQRNSDGSIGSLWRCADEIYDCLNNGGHYFYYDREFWIETLNTKKYEVRTTYVRNIEAMNIIEAEGIAMKDLCNRDGIGGDWSWCEDTTIFPLDK